LVERFVLTEIKIVIIIIIIIMLLPDKLMDILLTANTALHNMQHTKNQKQH